MLILVLAAAKNLKMKQVIDQLIYERAPWLTTYSRTTEAVGKILKACLNYKTTIEQANRLKCLSGIEILNTVGDEIARQVTISGLEYLARIPTNEHMYRTSRMAQRKA